MHPLSGIVIMLSDPIVIRIVKRSVKLKNKIKTKLMAT